MSILGAQKKAGTSPKICVGASAGGHMNQLLALLEFSSMWPHKPDFCITTLSEMVSKLSPIGRVYVIGEANRKMIIKAISVIYKGMKIAFYERPDVVITTGSMPMALFCFWAKLTGAKIVWIDSIANIEKISLSGRFVICFADLFLTQWPELAERNPKAEYAGQLL